MPPSRVDEELSMDDEKYVHFHYCSSITVKRVYSGSTNLLRTHTRSQTAPWFTCSSMINNLFHDSAH